MNVLGHHWHIEIDIEIANDYFVDSVLMWDNVHARVHSEILDEISLQLNGIWLHEFLFPLKFKGVDLPLMKL